VSLNVDLFKVWTSHQTGLQWLSTFTHLLLLPSSSHFPLTNKSCTSFLPKSPPGFIVATRRKAAAALISSTSSSSPLPFSASTRIFSVSRTLTANTTVLEVLRSFSPACVSKVTNYEWNNYLIILKKKRKTAGLGYLSKQPDSHTRVRVKHMLLMLSYLCVSNALN